MTFQGQNLNGGDGFGSENPLDMVLDNLGMDDQLIADLNDDNLPGDDNDDGFPSDPIDQRRDARQDNRAFERPQPGRQPVQPQRGQQPPQRGIPQNAEVRPDARGNLVDANGQVVARAGFEARMYQDTVRARAALTQEQGRTNDLTQRLNRAIEIGQGFHQQMTQLQTQLQTQGAMAQQLGLDQNETLQAMQLMAEAKRDPVETIKKLLTMAASRGVDLTKIGIPAGGVDSKSLMDLVRGEISRAMTPLQQRTEMDRQNQQREEQAAATYREVESETQNFFRDNPAAAEFIPVFHAVLSEPRFAHMSLGEVWARIQLNQERMARDPQYNGNGNRAPARGQNPQPRRSIPAGRGNPPRQNQFGDMAPVTASYDSILRDTLDALGV